MKQCSRCKSSFDESMFFLSKRTSDGLYSSCKNCRREYRNANREKINSVKREYRHKILNEGESKIANGMNKSWKGGSVGKIALHDWIRHRKPKPKLCECCGKRPPKDLANISQEYQRDVSDFEWLCRKCHLVKDGRIENLKQNQS